MAVNIPGLIGVIVFYIIILVIGLVAGRKKAKSDKSETQFLADRGLGLFVGSFTLCATMVGGAYINGTAEEMAKNGLIWALVAPVGYNVGITIAGVLFAPKVRAEGYTTIFDPLQNRYGTKMGALLFFNELLANVFWEAAVLSALGTSLASIIGLDVNIAVIVSACVAVVYTFFGGLYSVAYTDVIQLTLITVGLVLALPFAYTNGNVDLSRIDGKWVGTMPPQHIASYIDIFLGCVFGGIPWQSYYQRVLACKSPSLARNASLLGVVLSVFLMIPPLFIGVVGSAADWNATSYDGPLPLTDNEWRSIVPMVLQFLCPVAVSVIGLGAISAAVMSSADSIILASGSVMARNVYLNVFRPKASDREVMWVMRITILVVGALGAIIALTVHSINGLFILCGDMMYVAQFPQLVCALWLSFGNAYGSFTGFILGFLLRFLSGERLLGIPDVIKFPNYDTKHVMQLFPYKTFSMLCTFGGIILVSYLTNLIFTRGWLSKKYDIFKCFVEDQSENVEQTDEQIPMNSKLDDNRPSPDDHKTNDADVVPTKTKEELQLLNNTKENDVRL